MKITQQLAHQPTVATVDCALCPLQENKVLPVSQQPKCPPESKTYCVFGGNSAQKGDSVNPGSWSTPWFCAMAAELSPGRLPERFLQRQGQVAAAPQILNSKC